MLCNGNQLRQQYLGILYLDGTSLMPLRSIKNSTTKILIRSLAILSIVVILLYLFVPFWCVLNKSERF